MDINESGNFERIWFFTFGVQRLNGVADAVGKWMTSGASAAGNAKHIQFDQCEAAARRFFGDRPHLAAVADDYFTALGEARRLTGHHASFLERRADGDIGSLLADAINALNGFAAVLDQLPGYPTASAEAAALRHAAVRCASLRPGASPS